MCITKVFATLNNCDCLHIDCNDPKFTSKSFPSERMRLTKERAESLKKDIQLMKIEMLDLEKETNTNRLGFKNYMEDIEQKFQLLLTNNSAGIK